MQISSPAVDPATKELSAAHTCDGAGESPPLTIRGVPAGARSLALFLDDPDAPSGSFVHWVVWNLPAQDQEIAAGSLPSGAVQGRTSTGESAYVPPCPPSGMHRYIFTFSALDTSLDLPSSAPEADVQRAMEGHVLESVRLESLYGRGR